MNNTAFPGQTTAPIPIAPNTAQDSEFTLLQKICQNLYVFAGAVNSGIVQTSAVLNGSATFDTTGLATSAKQDTAQTSLGSILAKISADPATQTTLAAVLAKITADPATQTTLAAVLAKLNATIGVTGTFWQATQPVSGTFYQATQPVSAAALPLPTGAATSAKQDTLQTAVDAINTKTIAPAELAHTIVTATTNGTVAAGKRAITFILSADFTGTIDGANFYGSIDSQYSVPIPSGDSCDAIPYTVSGGFMRIATLA